MLRPATGDDHPLLREIKDAAQDRLSQTGSLQVLSEVEDVEGYWLFWASDIVGDEADIERCALSRVGNVPAHYEPAPIGSCRLSTHIPAHIAPWLPTHPDVYLSSLIVHPTFQSRGLGRQMMSELQALGKSMALDVWAGNDRLRRWYEELGWKFVATVEERDEDQVYDVAVYVWP